MLFILIIFSNIIIISSIYHIDSLIEYGLLGLYLFLLLVILGQGFIAFIHITFLSYFTLTNICLFIMGIQ